MTLLKDIARIKVIVDKEDQLLAHSTGNTLPADKSYSHLSGISIQQKVKRRHAYCCTNVIKYILSQCQNCYRVVTIHIDTERKMSHRYTDRGRKRHTDIWTKRHIGTRPDGQKTQR